jgi:hypothetical protein
MNILLGFVLFLLYGYIYFNLKTILVRIGLVKLSKYDRTLNTVIIILIILYFMVCEN